MCREASISFVPLVDLSFDPDGFGHHSERASFASAESAVSPVAKLAPHPERFVIVVAPERSHTETPPR
jgi:hypothetical protein